MGIGLSDGTSYNDQTEWVADTMSKRQFDDAQEMSANSASGDFQSRFLAANVPQTSGIDPEQLKQAYLAQHGVEDRRDDSFWTNLSGVLNNSFSKQKAADVWAHPLASPGQRGMLVNADENQVPPSTMGNALGSQDINPPKYQTALTTDEQTKYNARFGPDDSQDYDMQGWFKANPNSQPNDPGVHYPDTYKKPNHMTFSDESIYHGIDGNQGGHWGTENGQDTFTPGPTNLAQHTPQEIRDYFTKVEPNVKLNMPPSEEGPKLNTNWFQDLKDTFLKSQAAYQQLPEEQKTEMATNAAMSFGPGTIGKVKIPITEGGKPVAVDLTQKPLFWDSKKNTWTDTDPGELPKTPTTVEDLIQQIKDALNVPEDPAFNKLSPKEAFKQGVQELHDKFQTSVAEIKNKFMNTIRSPWEAQAPVVKPQGDYTEPAYRGLTVYSPGGTAVPIPPNPVFNFTKSSEMYSTANPALADMYAGYLNSHPGYHVPPSTFSEGSQVMPLLINTKDYHYYDAKGGRWQEHNPKAVGEARDAGKKGVIVDNVFDEPNSTTALGKPSKIYITLPEGAGTVKSRFAERFDPSSPNIMHTVAGIGVGSTALGYMSMHDTDQPATN